MILAIDVGGTKTLLTVFDENRAIIETTKFPTPQEYDKFIRELAKTVDGLTTKDFTACVIAIPGLLDRAAGILLSLGNLPWENKQVVADLSNFIKCPIYMENDANLAGLSEANEVLGEYKRTLYITVSTGIGGVIIQDGRIDEPTRDMEPGHMLLEYGDKLVRWEDFGSGRALVARTGKRASDIPEGDPEWYRVARNVAIGLINVIANTTPECIIIGGGVGTHLDKFKEQLTSELELYKNEMLRVPPILKAQHPEEAVVYGCFIYAKQLS